MVSDRPKPDTCSVSPLMDSLLSVLWTMDVPMDVRRVHFHLAAHGQAASARTIGKAMSRLYALRLVDREWRGVAPVYWINLEGLNRVNAKRSDDR